MARRSRLFLASFAFAALAPASVPLLAAELGDPRVASHIGQPLVADVELTMLEDAAVPVQVRVASPEVYSGAGIAMPAVLSSLNLSVMRRDGRQFLHVTSPRPVDADHVHLYLELVDKGQRAVRLATLWLTPDPNPAPARAAAPAPVVVPALAATATPAAAGTSTAVPEAVLLAQVERARTARPPAPPAPSVVRKSHPAHGAKAPALPAAQPDTHPPACARPAAEVQACAALGEKNDELRARLGQVEDRVKKLQVTLGAAPAAPKEAGKTEPEEAEATPASSNGAPKAAAGTEPAREADAKPARDAPQEAAAEPPKPAVPAGPRPIHSIKPLVPHKPKAPPPDAGLPWGWIGAAAVLALGGAGAFVAVRRRAARAAPADDTPGLFDQLKARFAARTKAPEPVEDEVAEPTLE